ncbi:MAG TPA: hypothetical protein VHA14_16855, partial [Bryobacteraceae bacterium]|nr:hypothetical protein [Bryobacteraceae bacterium]
MARWTRLAVGLLMTVGFAAAQSAPAVSSPAPAAENTANSAPVASAAPAATPAGSSPAGCPAGASWFCVTQTLQRLMFNLDGTHKADAEIAQSVPNAIQQMIQDGVLKPSNAPKKPIKGFDDANDFLIHYMSDAPATAPAAAAPSPSAPVAAAPETASATPPAAAPESTSAPASADCPKDKPWLCPVAGPAPAQAKTQAGTPSPSA